MYARARFSVALSLVQLKRLDDAFATLRTLADRAPSATLMNNIGVIQLRRPVTPQTGRATYYFNQALNRRGERTNTSTRYAYWAEKDAPSAIFWLRGRFRDRRWRGARGARGSAAGYGCGRRSARERELATQLSSTTQWRRSRRGRAPTIARPERLKPSLEVSTLRRVDSVIARRGSASRRTDGVPSRRGRRFFGRGATPTPSQRGARDLPLALRGGGDLLMGRIYCEQGKRRRHQRLKLPCEPESVEGRIALAQAYLR